MAPFTLPALPAGARALVKIEINPDAPREPTRPRDAQGRFRRRTGIVFATGDCGGVRVSTEIVQEEQR